jgi:hypothetical protein
MGSAGAGAASPDGGTGGSASAGSSVGASAVGGTSVARRVNPNAVMRARVAAEGAISSPVSSTMGGPPEVQTLPPLGR